MDAVYNNDYKQVKDLLDSGVSPNLETASGLTPIQLALHAEHDSILSLLIQYHGKIDSNELYNKAIKDNNLALIKQFHKSGYTPFIYTSPSYFDSSFSIVLFEYLIPFFEKSSYNTQNLFSPIPLPQSQKEAKKQAALIKLMISNGFFPKTALDSLWLRTIAKRSMDSTSFLFSKKEGSYDTRLNSALTNVSSLHSIDSLLVIGADPLGPTEYRNQHALDRKRQNPNPFDWKVVSFFQKRDPIRIKPLLNNDDLFFIALVEGNISETKKSLKKINLLEKDSVYLKKILPTATYSKNLDLILYIKNLSIPFYESSWKSSFSDAFQSKNVKLIQILLSMHPDKEKVSQYVHSSISYENIDFTNFYEKIKYFNQLLSLNISTKPFENKIYSFYDNKIKIKFDSKLKLFIPIWEFESIYSFLEERINFNYNIFQSPAHWNPITIETSVPTPPKPIKDSLFSPSSKSWEFSGNYYKCPAYALVEYKNQLYASTECLKLITSKDGGFTWESLYSIDNPFTSLVVHENHLFGSAFSPSGTESVFKYIKKEGWRRSSYGLYRESDSLKSTRNKLFSISNNLYFADSAVQKTYRFDFETYTWNKADTSLIEFIDEQYPFLKDTLISKSGVPLVRKKSVYQIVEHNKRLFAATKAGLLFSEDHGDHWAYVSIKKEYANARDLFSSTVNISFIENDSLFLSSNGGYHWESTPAGDLSVNDFLQVDSTIFIASKSGIYKKRENEPLTFSMYTHTKSLAFFDNKFWAASGDNGTRISLDSGETWDLERCFKPSYPAINKFLQNENNLYAASDRGVYEYEQTKACWIQKPTKGLKNKNLLSIVANEKYLFALNEEGLISQAKIPIKEWKPLSNKINKTSFIASSLFIHNNTLIIGTDIGPLFSYDQGNTWVSHDTNLPIHRKVESMTIFQNILYAIIDDRVFRFDLSQK